MASASSLARFNASGGSGEIGLETVEIDPQFAGGLGFAEGDVVCELLLFLRFGALVSGFVSTDWDYLFVFFSAWCVRV